MVYLRWIAQREKTRAAKTPNETRITGVQNGEHFGRFVQELGVLNGIEPQLTY
jgi:hypothetical protein